MAGGAETFKGALSYAGPLASLFQSGRKAAGGFTAAEKAADKARQDAIQASEDELSFKKNTAASNNAAAQDAINQINGQASDAELASIMQMLQNGVSPEDVASQMGYDGRDQGADYSMFGVGQPPTAPAASTGTRTPAQAPAPSSGGLRQALAKNPNVDWSQLGGPVTDANGEQYTIGEDGEYRNANGERYYGAEGGRSIDGDRPLGQTGVSRDPMLGQVGQDKRLRFAINGEGGYTPGSVGYQYGQGGGNTGLVPKGFESKAAKSAGVGDYDPALVAQAQAIANKGRWSQKGEYDKNFAARANVFKQLEDGLNGIQDPEAAAALKDVENKAFRSDSTKAAQGFAMDKLKGLTDTKETAEERLMREVARRNQENQMVAQRKATLGNLAARGQLGSGAELASMLGSQATTSSNRVLDEMAANANAQKRAIAALGKYGDMGLALGGQDIAEGAQANQTSQFNNALNEQHSQFVTKNQQQNKADKTKRIATIADAGNDVLNAGDRHTDNLTTTVGNNAALKIGTATGGAKLLDGAGTKFANDVVAERERQLAEEDAKGGGLL